MFDEIAHLYDGLKADHDYRVELSELLNAVSTVDARSPASMLDLGCGTGRLLAAVSDGPSYRVGLDSSPRMIDIARRADPQGNYCVGDFEYIPIRRSFDLVTCMGAIAYARGPQGLDRLTRGIAGHLTPQGTAVIKCWYSSDEWQQGATRIRRNSCGDSTYTRFSRLSSDGAMDFVNIRHDSEGTEVVKQHQTTLLTSIDALGSSLHRAGLAWRVGEANTRLVVAHRYPG